MNTEKDNKARGTGKMTTQSNTVAINAKTWALATPHERRAVLREANIGLRASDRLDTYQMKGWDELAHYHHLLDLRRLEVDVTVRVSDGDKPGTIAAHIGNTGADSILHLDLPPDLLEPMIVRWMESRMANDGEEAQAEVRGR